MVLDENAHLKRPHSATIVCTSVDPKKKSSSSSSMTTRASSLRQHHNQQQGDETNSVHRALEQIDTADYNGEEPQLALEIIDTADYHGEDDNGM